MIFCKNCDYFNFNFKDRGCRNSICFEQKADPINGWERIRLFDCYTRRTIHPQGKEIKGLNDNFDCQYYKESDSIWKKMKRLMKLN